MNKFNTIFLLLFLAATWSCNRPSKSTDEPSTPTVAPELNQDSILRNDSIQKEIARQHYADSLTNALVASIDSSKRALYNGEIDFNTFTAQIQKSETNYMNYQESIKFVPDDHLPQILMAYQRDTFLLNERLRLFDEYFTTTSDMELSYSIYLHGLDGIRDTFENKLMKLSLGKSTINALKEEIQLRDELDEHEHAFSSNIFSSRYLPGAIYSMINQGSQIANHELATQSAVNMYLLFSDNDAVNSANRLPENWLNEHRNNLRKSYREIYPLLNDNDRMILEEENALFSEFVKQRLKIVNMSKGARKDGLLEDLAKRIARKQSDLNYYKKALTNELFSTDEENGEYEFEEFDETDENSAEMGL